MTSSLTEQFRDGHRVVINSNHDLYTNYEWYSPKNYPELLKGKFRPDVRDFDAHPCPKPWGNGKCVHLWNFKSKLIINILMTEDIHSLTVSYYSGNSSVYYHCTYYGLNTNCTAIRFGRNPYNCAVKETERWKEKKINYQTIWELINRWNNYFWDKTIFGESLSTNMGQSSRLCAVIERELSLKEICFGLRGTDGEVDQNMIWQ